MIGRAAGLGTRSRRGSEAMARSNVLAAVAASGRLVMLILMLLLLLLLLLVVSDKVQCDNEMLLLGRCDHLTLRVDHHTAAVTELERSKINTNSDKEIAIYSRTYEKRLVT